MKDLVTQPHHADFANAVIAVLERRLEPGARDPSPALWADLGDVGLLGICTDLVGGQPSDLVVGLDALGQGLCPGPVVAAVAVSPSLVGSLQADVVSGRTMLTVTDGAVVPWAAASGCVVELSGDQGWLVTASGDVVDTVTLSGESWATGRFQRGAPLADPARAFGLFQLGLSAYLGGAAYRLVLRAAEYAGQREQFGRPIGDFQAVAHPLASSFAEISAVRDLCRCVALEAATNPLPTARASALRHQAAASAKRAATRVHQVMGAVGFAREGGIAEASTRIHQWAALPPSSDSPDWLR
jgi:alkylation response protein AidB-like acyl-CoA dehydrogenase